LALDLGAHDALIPHVCLIKVERCKREPGLWSPGKGGADEGGSIGRPSVRT